MKAPILFNINFTLLLQGLLVSQLGSTIYFVAIALWVKENTQSATTLGLIGVATFLPSILIGPLAVPMLINGQERKSSFHAMLLVDYYL